MKAPDYGLTCEVAAEKEQRRPAKYLARSVDLPILRSTKVGYETIQEERRGDTAVPEEAMKYVCFGYLDDSEKWDAIPESEREAVMKECFAYDEMLKKAGHFVRGELLQSARNAATVRWRNGRASVTDGPYTETKEQLGGLLVLEAKDLNEAIRLMSKHPGLRHGGPFEIRALDEEMTERANRGTV